MSSSDTEMNDRDDFICEAFGQILAGSATESRRLNPETARAITTYLAQLPPEDQLKPAVMANHITAFCLQPGNEELDEWLGEVYDRLDPEGIQNVVKKTGDPDDTADGPSKMPRKEDNEGRDICLKLQTLVRQIQDQDQNQSQTPNQNDNQPNP